MAGDPLSTLRTLTYDRVGISEDDPKFGSTTMTNMVNAALKQVSADFDPWWLLTDDSLAIVASTINYALTTLTRFRKVQRIVDDEGYDLQAVGKRELGRYTRLNGRPNVYLVEGGNITVGPTPQSAYTYTVWYYQNEIPLSSDSDQPALPVEYTDYLVCRAGKLAVLKMRDFEMSREMDKEIEAWKKRIADDMRQMKANPRIILRDEG